MSENHQLPTNASVLEQLMRVIEQRYRDRPPKSYTSKLFEGGVPLMGEKILEEAREVVEAAAEPGEAGRTHFIHEVADLLYHTWVLVGSKEVSLHEIEAELARRFGISGLDEKASRTKPTTPPEA